MKTYSDGSTNYETGSVIHQSLNMNDVTIVYFIVDGVSYYQMWFEVSSQSSNTKFTEVSYKSDTGVKTQWTTSDKSNVTSTNVPIDYWNLFNA